MVVVGGLVWTPVWVVGDGMVSMCVGLIAVWVVGDGVVSMCVGFIVFVFLRY